MVSRLVTYLLSKYTGGRLTLPQQMRRVNPGYPRMSVMSMLYPWSP